MGSLRLHRAALIAIREAKGYDQQTLAGRANMSRGYLSRLEKGERIGTTATLQRLAEALSVDLRAITYPTAVPAKAEEVAA